jgi:hypothetical protein
MRGRVRRWTDEQLRDAVSGNTCLTDVVRALGLRPAGGSHSFVKGHIRRLNLQTDHFTRDRQGRGLEAIRNRKRRTQEEIFCEGSTVTGKVLRRAARKVIAPYRCSGCENPGEHRGRPLVLQLHHRNGTFNDNRRENLEWNCPNCHSQSETFAGRGTSYIGASGTGKNIDTAHIASLPPDSRDTRYTDSPKLLSL